MFTFHPMSPYVGAPQGIENTNTGIQEIAPSSGKILNQKFALPIASNFCPTLKLLLAFGNASENNFAGAERELVHSKYLDQENPL